MDVEKLIEDLRVACAGNQHNIMGVAATDLSALWYENKRLKNKLSELAHLPFDEPGIGERTRLMAENEKLHDLWSDASIRLEDELAENEKLRAKLEQKSKLIAHQAAELERRDILLKEQEDVLEQIKAERDAALEHLHGICFACVNYSPYHNTGKCAFCVYEPAREKDVEANDNWQWRGPKKED